MKGKGVEGIRAAGTERTGINGDEGDVLWERLLGGGMLGEGRLGETAPRSGQHAVGMIGGRGLRADARSTQQRLFSGGILGEGVFLSGGFEVAVDGDVDVLIETGIRFETGFRFGATFDYMEIMMEETESPFDAFRRVVVFEGVSEFLGGFDEFAVSYAGCRPSLGEMVRIELVETAKTRNTADDDVLAVFLAYLVGIHHSAGHQWDINSELHGLEPWKQQEKAPLEKGCLLKLKIWLFLDVLTLAVNVCICGCYSGVTISMV